MWLAGPWWYEPAVLHPASRSITGHPVGYLLLSLPAWSSCDVYPAATTAALISRAIYLTIILLPPGYCPGGIGAGLMLLEAVSKFSCAASATIKTQPLPYVLYWNLEDKTLDCGIDRQLHPTNDVFFDNIVALGMSLVAEEIVDEEPE